MQKVRKDTLSLNLNFIINRKNEKNKINYAKLINLENLRGL